MDECIVYIWLGLMCIIMASAFLISVLIQNGIMKTRLKKEKKMIEELDSVTRLIIAAGSTADIEKIMRDRMIRACLKNISVHNQQEFSDKP